MEGVPCGTKLAPAPELRRSAPSPVELETSATVRKTPTASSEDAKFDFKAEGLTQLQLPRFHQGRVRAHALRSIAHRSPLLWS